MTNYVILFTPLKLTLGRTCMHARVKNISGFVYLCIPNSCLLIGTVYGKNGGLWMQSDLQLELI